MKHVDAAHHLKQLAYYNQMGQDSQTRIGHHFCLSMPACNSGAARDALQKPGGGIGPVARHNIFNASGFQSYWKSTAASSTAAVVLTHRPSRARVPVLESYRKIDDFTAAIAPPGNLTKAEPLYRVSRSQAYRPDSQVPEPPSKSSLNWAHPDDAKVRAATMRP
jgi:hypothetical protein